MSSPAKQKCIRCSSELPSGSGYCVSCGFQNEDLTARMVKAESDRRDQLDKLKSRIGMQRMFGGLMRFFGR